MAAEDTDVTPWPVVCAIDFGTTYSGYAYSMRPDYERNPLNIESNPPWFNEGQGTSKTPTCILFDKSGNFHSFGYDAERKYATLAERAQEKQEDEEEDEDSDDEDDSEKDEENKDKPKEDGFDDWLFFRRFKMKLFQDASVRRNRKLKNLNLQAENGKKLPALKIFSEAIRFLKEHFEGLLEKATLRDDNNASNNSATTRQGSENSNTSGNLSEPPDDFDDDDDKKDDPIGHETSALGNEDISSWSADILWVLTVPAIWSDEAKQFMREAAIQAGIQDDHLVLALEPESAALLCKQLALTKAAQDINIRMFDPGSKFMVVDCGGGTVDVTSYEVKENSSLKELHCASGDAVGGTNVDKLFFDLINSIFGEDIVNKFKCNSPSDWLELLRSFEVKKKGIGKENINNEKAEPVTFSNLGDLFKEFAKSNENKSVATQIQEMGLKKKIKKFSSAKLRIDENFLIEKVFQGPIEDVTNHLKELFTKEEIADIGIILLVGGFSECPLLQKAIQSQFRDKKVINPREGSVAVMKGAVLFGHSPENLVRKAIEKGLEVTPITTESIIRKSKAYYGVATDVPFIEGEHLPLYRSMNQEGEIVCTDVFDCLIKKNQELEIGKTIIEKRFNSSTSHKANVEIYRANSDVQYCNNEGCKIIGHIRAVFEDDCFLPERRIFKVQLHFGFTEKIATAVDLTTNKSWKVKLNCLL
ncbi:heat shock 70 kDa protein 12B-like [Saccostrea cucullata]|uniref:heat shock 70 kDa protein 12B-like n=1 Tax=Saccostrea cuccullata TaxID=36930 RepID=UPI002ED6A732